MDFLEIKAPSVTQYASQTDQPKHQTPIDWPFGRGLFGNSIATKQELLSKNTLVFFDLNKNLYIFNKPENCK